MPHEASSGWAKSLLNRQEEWTRNACDDRMWRSYDLGGGQKKPFRSCDPLSHPLITPNIVFGRFSLIQTARKCIGQLYIIRWLVSDILGVVWKRLLSFCVREKPFHSCDPLSHPILFLIQITCKCIGHCIDKLYIIMWLVSDVLGVVWKLLLSLCDNQQGRTYVYANAHVRTTWRSKYKFFSYSKTFLKRLLKNRHKYDLNDKWCLMKVERIREFLTCIKRQLSLKTKFWSSFWMAA